MLFSISILISCQNNIEEIDDSTHEIETKSSGDGKYDLLGYGYDIEMSDYWNPTDTKSRVIDIEKLVRENPTCFDSHKIPTQNRSLIFASNSSDYYSQLCGSASSSITTIGFRGSLALSFSQEDIKSENNAFASIHIDITSKRIYVNAPKELLRKYITEEFKRDIVNQNGRYILAKYGTVVMTDIILGGRLQIFYKSHNTSNSSEKKISVNAGFKAGLMSSFGIDIAGSSDKKYTEKNSQEEISYRTQGGDYAARLGGDITFPYNGPTLNADKWIETCNESNMVLINVQKNGWLPVCELVPPELDPNKEIYWALLEAAMNR